MQNNCRFVIILFLQHNNNKNEKNVKNAANSVKCKENADVKDVGQPRMGCDDDPLHIDEPVSPGQDTTTGPH
jgi:hypothetical protein